VSRPPIVDHLGSPFRHFRERINGVDLHVAMAGSGAPVYLVHGCPKTMASWRHLAPYLTAHHTVVLHDTRGFGDSERPLAGYDTHTLADDVAALATRLDHPQFSLVGEDWGAAVAYTVAASHRDRVLQLVFQEMRLPGLSPDPDTDEVSPDDTRTGWHFSFFAVPGYPELLIPGRERAFWTQFVRRQAHDVSAVLEEDLDEIVAGVSRPGGLHAVLSLYRAHQIDAEQNRQHLTQRLHVPVLAVGGASYLGDEVRRHMEQAAHQVQGLVLPATGHHPALEVPRLLAEHLLAFFDQA